MWQIEQPRHYRPRPASVNLRYNMAKRYYSLCCIMLIIGIGISVLSAEFPDSADGGEMPLAFGAGLYIAFIAILGVAAGLIAQCLSAVIKKLTR
ncbi:hypothetical protein GGER_20640 [Serratia rubidaea]